MAYIINKFSGEQLIVLEDGTIDTSTSLGLVGRNYVGYGETQNENFVFLLENFANAAPPPRPLTGQVWFDSVNNVINTYNGTAWNPVGNAVVSDNEPVGPTEGQLWLSQAARQLFVYTAGSWNLIGPEAAIGFGTTRARSTTIRDTNGNNRPVIQLLVNDVIIAISSAVEFTIASSDAIEGFNSIARGLTFSTSSTVRSNLQGNASTATLLQNPRTINGVTFSGGVDITISANTTNQLVAGNYILGGDFNGSTLRTWAVDATSENVNNKVVARDNTGGFSAGTISANLVGNVTGNVTATTGTSRFNVVEANSFVGATLTGNAFTATKLQTSRTINGVSFNGTQDIVVTASAQTLTGATINSTVVNSNLKNLGILARLEVEEAGITVGSNFKLSKQNNDSIINAESGRLTLAVGSTNLSIQTAANSLSQGWDAVPTLAPLGVWNIGSLPNKFGKIFATEFKGNADSATLATTSTNLAGGGTGSIPYQISAGNTAMLPVGAPGTFLRASGGNTLEWGALDRENLVRGNHLTFTNIGTNTSTEFYNSGVPVRIAVDATSTNTANKVVVRDSNGNFSAGTVNANLVGNVSGNATTATRLETARTINGVAFNGTSNISIPTVDPTKLPLSGGTMTNFLTLHANPINNLHAATKNYVDSRQFTITSGNTVFSTSGFTNQVGSFNNNANFFDVFPPSGKSMANLVAFIPSIAVIHFNGNVNFDDSMRCTWVNLGDRIRVYVQNTEQRSAPAANYLAIWS
jgi:hypothetical protein